MLNHFQKLFLFFLLCSALAIYTMETNSDDNQRPLYNQEANSKLLHIINTNYENYEQPTSEEAWENIVECLKRKADPNIKGKDDVTIIQLACFEPKSNIKAKKYLRYFLERGADPNIGNRWGYSPLQQVLLALKHAPQNFNLEMLEPLLQYNANPNLPFICKAPNTQEDYSMSPLDFTAVFGSKDSVKILLKYGADINIASPFYFDEGTCYNLTPLGRAILFDNTETTEALCKGYASLEDISDVNGETAFEFAVKELKKPEPIIKTLIVNARFKLPTTEKKVDSIALELLLILKNQFKFQIPTELKFRILSILPALQNFEEPDSILYKKLFHTNYREPYLFSRLMCHRQNIKQIVNKENKSGGNAFMLLKYNEETKAIIPKLRKDIKILLQSNQKISPDNLALQIYNNYEELLEEKQAQNTK